MLEGREDSLWRGGLTKQPQVRSALPGSFRLALNEANKPHLILQLHIVDGQHHHAVDPGTIHADPLCELRSGHHVLHRRVLVVDTVLLGCPGHLKIL